VVYTTTQRKGNQNGPTLQPGELCEPFIYQQNEVRVRVPDVTVLRQHDRGPTGRLVRRMIIEVDALSWALECGIDASAFDLGASPLPRRRTMLSAAGSARPCSRDRKPIRSSATLKLSELNPGLARPLAGLSDFPAKAHWAPDGRFRGRSASASG